jgi:hypothetical protein
MLLSILIFHVQGRFFLGAFSQINANYGKQKKKGKL